MLQRVIVLLLVLLLSVQMSSCKKTKLIQGQTQVAEPVLIGGYEKKDMHFKVQIGAFEKALAHDDVFFENIVGEEVRKDVNARGLHCYSLGFFKNYDKADAYEQTLKTRGYTEAFVVAFGDDNVRIELPMKEILRLYNLAK